MIDRSKTIIALASECHNKAVESGWWTNLDDGSSQIGKRDFIQLSGLSMTEVQEAFEGGQSPDDKLPEMPAFQVEIADAFIRQADMAGGCYVDLASAFEMISPHADLTYAALPIHPDVRSMQHRAVACMLINGEISKSIECQRKRKLAQRDVHVARSMVLCFQLAAMFGYDLESAIRAKLEYNANRPDHKLENRAAEGGKKE